MRSCRLGGSPTDAAPPDGVPAGAPTAGANAELGIICVPATPLRGFPIAEASPPAGPPGAGAGDDGDDGDGGDDGDIPENGATGAAGVDARAFAGSALAGPAPTFASALATAAAAAFPTFGFAFDVAASDISPSGLMPITARDAGVLAAATSNAPREDRALLMASGDTCGWLAGSPIPRAVAANSGGTLCGPWSDLRSPGAGPAPATGPATFFTGPAVCANGFTCDGGGGG